MIKLFNNTLNKLAIADNRSYLYIFSKFNCLRNKPIH